MFLWYNVKYEQLFYFPRKEMLQEIVKLIILYNIKCAIKGVIS